MRLNKDDAVSIKSDERNKPRKGKLITQLEQEQQSVLSPTATCGTDELINKH